MAETYRPQAGPACFFRHCGLMSSSIGAVSTPSGRFGIKDTGCWFKDQHWYPAPSAICLLWQNVHPGHESGLVSASSSALGALWAQRRMKTILELQMNAASTKYKQPRSPQSPVSVRLFCTSWRYMDSEPATHRLVSRTLAKELRPPCFAG